MAFSSDNSVHFNGQITRQHDHLSLESFKGDGRMEVHAREWKRKQNLRDEESSSCEMDVDDYKSTGQVTLCRETENYDCDSDDYDDQYDYEGEYGGEDDMGEEDGFQGNDLSLSEGRYDDVEMLNVQRKFRADTNEWYSRRHYELSLGEYRDDIYKYLREVEILSHPNAEYMTRQSEINHRFRSTLVDWMVYLTHSMNLKRETLFLSVNYLDRYMSVKNVPKSMLQIIGLACIHLAGKSEEGEPPSLGTLANENEKRHIRVLELSMLNSFQFKTNVPTANFFVLDLLNQFSLRETEYAMTLYILETTLVYGDKFLVFLPSFLATSCFLFTHILLKLENRRAFMDKITSLTGYDYQQLYPCLNVILNVMQNLSSKFTNVKEEYLSDRYYSVSNIVIPKDLTFEQFVTDDFMVS